MMNKKLIVITLLTAATWASVAQASDGTIKFTGNILDAACIVTPATANQTVDLGAVNKASFSAAGNTAAPTKFGIELSACPESARSATVKFDGPTHPDNLKLLALTQDANVATGVGVGLYEEDSTTVVPVGVASAGKPLSTSVNTRFNFVAKYVSTVSVVTEGTANAVSDFTISYN